MLIEKYFEIEEFFKRHQDFIFQLLQESNRASTKELISAILV